MTKGGDPSDNPFAATQARIAEQLFSQTDPIRKNLINRSQGFLEGGIDSSPAFEAFRAQSDPILARARENIIQQTPEGGGLISALSNLDTERARMQTQARGQIDEQERNLAVLLGTGTIPQTMQGLGSASFAQAQNLASAQQREGAIYSAIGEGAGAAMGGK